MVEGLEGKKEGLDGKKGEAMRLIDADKLKADVVSWKNCYNGFSDTYDKTMIIDTIDEQPTIDAVPVVRCGECEYYFPYKNYDGRILGYHCQAPNQQTDFLEPTHYCGFGERRADEHI